jgi:hypothetical protein
MMGISSPGEEERRRRRRRRESGLELDMDLLV